MSDREKVIGKECLGVGLSLWGCYVSVFVKVASGLYITQGSGDDLRVAQ